jgi:hypothetical protein
LDVDEAWELTSLVVGRLLEQAKLGDADKAKVRRWRSESLRPSGELMRALARKINEDLAEVMARKNRSQIRKPDWR